MRRVYEGTFEERKVQASKVWQRRNRARHIFNARYFQSKRKGVEFSITLDWFLKRVAPMICEATGLPLNFDDDFHNPWLPSIDRVDPDAGYTPGNCRVVCWLYNRAKHVGPDEDVMKMALALSRRALQ